MSHWQNLKPYLTPERQEKMVRTAQKRTRHVRLVVQDVHHPHNVSACMRSAEGMGIQNIDVVNLAEPFRATTVARGVVGWLDVQKHPSVEGCAQSLHEQGFKIAAALPDRRAVPLGELPVDQPIALVFGNEHSGVAPEWENHLDYRFTIPMTGMAQSFNISVSAAISIYDIMRRSFEQHGEKLYISNAEQEKLLGSWAYDQLDSADEILKRLQASPQA